MTLHWTKCEELYLLWEDIRRQGKHIHSGRGEGDEEDGGQAEIQAQMLYSALLLFFILAQSFSCWLYFSHKK